MLAALTASAGLLLTAHGASAQRPQSHSQTSVVQRLAPDSAATPTVAGRMRELKCRGKPGIDMRVHQDPSPRQSDQVTMVLRYERLQVTRPLRQVGMVSVDDGVSVHFQPGGCTWGGTREDGFLSEPGIVYFDLPRDAQTHAAAGARDTSIEAAAHFPDVRSLPRFMSDSNRYWVFYVDDVTNVSISFGRWPLGGAAAPTHASVTGSLRDASPGSATLSSARLLSDSQRTTVLRAPNTAGAAAGSLRPPTVAPAPSTGDGVAKPRPAPGSDTLLSARAVTTGSRPGDARTSRTLLPDVRIWGVATAPGSQGVQLVFNTDRKHAGFMGRRGILVQFSQRRPPWDSAGRRWAYPPEWNIPWAAEITTPEHGGYMAEPQGRLELRQRYYYLITVESNDASLPPRQVIGSFIASVNPFAKGPPAPGPDPESNEVFGDALRGDATDAAGALRDQPAGATTAAGTTVRLPTAGTTAGAGISRTRLPPDVRIWGIETRPGDNGVTLWFETDRVWVRGSSRGVRVQFSTRQPAWEGGLLVSPGVTSEAREVTSGRFEAKPHWTLESGKRHYYLITVQSNDVTLRPRQATGSFVPAFGP